MESNQDAEAYRMNYFRLAEEMNRTGGVMAATR